MQVPDSDSTSLLSCMTLDIEHLHSTVNFKHGTQTMLQYARSFSTSVKESVKALANWSAFYYTSSEARWYPPPEKCLKLSDLSFPKPTVPGQLGDDNKVLMREWASVNGAVVRQRSGRQETTMAKAGTLPEGSYNVELRPRDNSIDDDVEEIQTDEEAAQTKSAIVPDYAQVTELESNDEVLEYDDDDSEVDDDDFDTDNGLVPVMEVGVETNFLLGRCSRYGRTVKFNSRFL